MSGTRSRSGVGLAFVASLALGLTAPAAQAADIKGAPVISGTGESGQTLTASASWTPPRLVPVYAWLRCTSPTDWWSCQILPNTNSATYLLQDEDAGKHMRVALAVASRNRSDEAVSEATTAIAPRPAEPAAPAPVPLPAPTPAATATPAPAPVFDAVPPQPTPAPNQGAVLRPSGVKLRAMSPAVTVRVRGVLSTRGADISLLSVRAPIRSRITVTCKGSGCPRKEYSTRRRTARVRVFERDLPARTRIEVRVRRVGYYGKSTVLIIRRGKAPYRLDRCLSARGAYTACPESS